MKKNIRKMLLSLPFILAEANAYARPIETLESLIKIPKEEARNATKDNYWVAQGNQKEMINAMLDYTSDKSGEFLTIPLNNTILSEKNISGKDFVTKYSSQTSGKSDVEVLTFLETGEKDYALIFKPKNKKDMYLVEKIRGNILINKITGNTPFYHNKILVNPVDGTLMSKEEIQKGEVTIEQLKANQGVLYNNACTIKTDREGFVGFLNSPPSKNVSDQDKLKPKVLQFKDQISSNANISDPKYIKELHKIYADAIGKYATESFGLAITSSVIDSNPDLEDRIRKEVMTTGVIGPAVEDKINDGIITHILSEGKEGIYFKKGHIPLYISNDSSRNINRYIKDGKRLLGIGRGRKNEFIIQDGDTVYLDWSRFLKILSKEQYQKSLGITNQDKTIPIEEKLDTLNVGVGYDHLFDKILPNGEIGIYSINLGGDLGKWNVRADLGYGKDSNEENFLKEKKANPKDPKALTAIDIENRRNFVDIYRVGGSVGYKALNDLGLHIGGNIDIQKNEIYRDIQENMYSRKRVNVQSNNNQLVNKKTNVYGGPSAGIDYDIKNLRFSVDGSLRGNSLDKKAVWNPSVGGRITYSMGGQK